MVYFMRFLPRELFKSGRTRKIKTILMRKQVSNPDEEVSKLLFYELYYKNIYSIILISSNSDLIHSEISRYKINFDSLRPLHFRTPWKRIGIGWWDIAIGAAFISNGARTEPPVFTVMKETHIFIWFYLLFRQSKSLTNC